ncbi:hypothetical protein D9V34_05150 [Mycetocola lacteus]|uniref:Uncharacterized protein n=1 Tax=Mycetocola lacteus TaxID=76637 RepID=A0A3L7AW63_9MICO|nr:hypothetical protein [Mycetocola lacteus]RLP84175.1 hypothetical protein D9V34_05150 [Mycetocola lacteus]
MTSPAAGQEPETTPESAPDAAAQPAADVRPDSASHPATDAAADSGTQPDADAPADETANAFDAAAQVAPIPPRKPTRREILRPVELLVIALIFGGFTGIIAAYASREPMLGLILGGVAFIVGLIGIAMFSLAIKPDDFEARDIHAQDTEGDQRPRAH